VAEASEAADIAISRSTFLALRLKMSGSDSCEMKGLHTVNIPAPPPGLEGCQDEEFLSSDVSTMESDCSSVAESESVQCSEPESSSVSSFQTEEYQVLLQNLPKAVLKESSLRVMMKEAALRDITKVSFRPDGRALVTVSSYVALQQCLAHFHGLPWFYAPNCRVPLISATHVKLAKKSSNKAKFSVDAPVFVPASSAALSADAPTFVPGSMAWSTELPQEETTKPAAVSSKIHRHGRCSSNASTQSDLSSDEASCGLDSDAESEPICVC
jgi:hypothetical protein